MTFFLKQATRIVEKKNKMQRSQYLFHKLASEVQKICTLSNNKLLLTFNIDHHDQLISFNQIQKLFLLNEIQIYITSQIYKNGIIRITADILKNGEYFTVSNLHKIFQLANYLNDLTASSKKITIKTNLNNLTFSISTSIKFSLQILKQNTQSILNFIVEQTQRIIQQTIFHIYYILFVGGQIDQLLFCILFQQNCQVHRKQNQHQKYQKQISKFIKTFCQSLRGKDPLIFAKRIKQFLESEAFSVCIDRTGFKTIDNLDAGTLKTTIKKVQKQPQVQAIKYFIPFLQQQRYKRPKDYKTQRYQNYAVVQLFKNNQQKQDTGWKLVRQQANSNIFANFSDIYFLQMLVNSKPVFFSDKIKRNLILKECQNKQKIKQQKNAISKLQSTSSNHIARYYRVSHTNKYKDKIVMNFEKEGSSQNYLFRSKKFSSINKLKFAKQLIQGLRILNEKKIVHMDLKFANILVGQDLATKISDFGQSYELSQYQKKENFDPNQHGFTLPYTPPQYFQQKHEIDQNYDIYSYGVMLHELLTRTQTLFSCRKLKMKSILSNRLGNKTYPNLILLNVERFEALFPSHISRLLMVIIILCLNPNSSKRPSADVISIMMSLIQGYLNKHLTI